MRQYEGEHFQDQTEVLDGNEYMNCTFTRCRLVYWGGPPPSLIDCGFEQCSWEFEEAAGRTVAFLRAIYTGTGPGGRELIRRTFDAR